MKLTELHGIVSQWYCTGQISNEEKEAVRLEYFRVTGTNEDGRCTRCPDFWNDVQLILRIHLKNQNMPVMADKARKWLIADNGTHVPHGSSIHYVNEGENSSYIQVLTDKVAEEFMKRNPDLKGTTFIENPDYVAPAKTVAAKPAAGSESKAKNPAKVKAPIAPAKSAEAKEGDESKKSETPE